jgi:hypothetical protein
MRPLLRPRLIRRPGQLDPSKGHLVNAATGDNRWQAAAAMVMRTPASPRTCPQCGETSVSGAWHVTDLLSRQGTIDLVCASCKTNQTLTVTLPPGTLPFYPRQRAPLLRGAIQEQMGAIESRIKPHADAMPVAAFTTSPTWKHAKWRGATYRWNPDHPRKVPPIMGLCFENADAGRKLFSQLLDYHGNEDAHDENRAQRRFIVVQCGNPRSRELIASLSNLFHNCACLGGIQFRVKLSDSRRSVA